MAFYCSCVVTKCSYEVFTTEMFLFIAVTLFSLPQCTVFDDLLNLHELITLNG